MVFAPNVVETRVKQTVKHYCNLFFISYLNCCIKNALFRFQTVGQFPYFSLVFDF